MRWQGLVTAVIGALLLMGGTASAEVRTVDFPCVESYVEAIREHPANQTRKAFDACQGEIETAVPFAVSRLKQKAVLTHVVAYEMAPYGPSNEIALSRLLESPTLNCGNFGVLAYWLHRRAWGREQAKAYQQVGWDNGPILNHAQTMVNGLLLDPTAGVVARVKYADLVSGIPTAEVVSFADKPELPRFTEDLAAWRIAVQDALALGQYRREQILYRWKIDALFP